MGRHVRVAVSILFVLAALAGTRASAEAAAYVPQSGPGIVRVFIDTEDRGEPGELATRRQSVRDLTSALSTKRKTLAIVDREDDADLVLEVVNRFVTIPKVVIGIGARPGQPAAQGAVVRVVVLRARLRFGEESVDFTNTNKPAETLGGWRSAADNIGDQVEKWIRNRRPKA